MRSLTVKLVLAFLTVTLLAVGVAGFVASQSTAAYFCQYLGHPSPSQWNGWGYMRHAAGMMGSGFGSAERRFLAQVYHSLWWAGLTGAGVGVFFSWLISRKVLAPTARLTAAVRRITAGQLAERVPVTSSDEIGVLAESFNKMAASLEQNENARRQLLADVAHELRTPLTVLQGNLEGMMDGVLEPSKPQIFSLHDECLRLSRLVTDLRDLSLAEAGKLTLNIEPVDVAEILEQASQLLRPLAEGKGVRLEDAQSKPELPPVKGDGDRLHQVIINLLTNAIRHTPQGGVVTTSVELVPGESERKPQGVASSWREPSSAGTAPALVISIADQGEGIPMAEQSHIFEHFYRVDRARSRDEGGTGLGLAIVKQLVEAHGGRVWVESSPGTDSTFRFTIPVV